LSILTSLLTISNFVGDYARHVAIAEWSRDLEWIQTLNQVRN